LLREVTMPKFGQTMTEGEILRWRKQEGDSVEKGEILLEIASDKTNLEVESEYTGIVKQILVREGTVVPCGQVIAYLETEN